MQNKRVTVITVCYNVERDIERTMLSVLNQSYQNIEYIIIDGASKDRTVDIAKHISSQYPKRDISVFCEPDKGIYDAMNKGISKATGDWLNFMNAGDTFASNSIVSEMVSEISDGISILRGNIIRNYNGVHVKSCGVVTQNPGLMDMFNNTFHHQACFIQRSLFSEYGLYSTAYKLCSDWKFFFDCVVLHHVKTKYVDKTVALFEMDGASSKNVTRYIDERESYLKSVLGEEVFECLKELDLYRKSTFATACYKLRSRLLSSLSPEMFNRLLTAKRMVRAFFHLKVN